MHLIKPVFVFSLKCTFYILIIVLMLLLQMNEEKTEQRKEDNTAMVKQHFAKLNTITNELTANRHKIVSRQCAARQRSLIINNY